MADPVNKICDELGVCREEALFYLEGFGWDLDAAIEACRSKTLPSPSVTVQSSPEAPRTPLMTLPYQPPDPEEEEKLRNEQIATFCGVALGATVDDARFYLSRTNWNLNAAVDAFVQERRPTAADRKSDPLHFSNDGGSTVAQSSPQMFPGNDLMQDVMSRVPQFQNNVKGVSIREPSSFSPTEDDTAEDEGPSTEERRQCIRQFLDVAPGASLRAAQNCLEACNWDVHEAAAFFGSGKPTQTTEKNLSSESEDSAEAPQDPLLNEESITSFQEMAFGATRQVAIDYLTHFNWNVNVAINHFLDGYPVKKSSAGMALSLQQNINVPPPSTGLPSESQFEASYASQSQDHLKEGVTGSSSSPINPVPRSVVNAGEGDVTVAIPGMSSSQVDLKGKAVEEESSAVPLANQDRTTVVAQTAPDAITITVVLADDGSGRQLELPFRPNQTVRDIRNAIDERAPLDNDRGYFLQSMTGEEYRDLNITVYRISTGGSTTLFQTLLDP